MAATPGPAFDRGDWQDDYAFLKQALQRDYANLAWFASPQGQVDLPALDRQTRRALAAAESDAQAEQAIRDFVAGLHDGHFSFVPTSGPRVDGGPATAGDIPARELAALDAASGCAAIGVAPGQRSAFSLPFETLPGFRLLSDGLDQPLHTGTYDAGNGVRIGLLRIPEFRFAAYPGLCRSQWSRLRAEDDDADDMRRDLEASLADAIATALKGFARSGVDRVLVDVGTNPGGGDSGDGYARLFTDRPVHSAQLLVAQSTAGEPYLDEQLARLGDALAHRHPDPAMRRRLERALVPFKAGKRAIVSGTPCDLSWAWRERRDWNGTGCRRLVAAGTSGGPVDALPADAAGELLFAHRLSWAEDYRDDWAAWTGPVYVLTDGKTYSAAEMFAARMQDNRIAKIVGQRTGGDGCGFMDAPDPVELPHSHLRLRMPNCVRLRADGDDEVAGIAPDLPVAPREGEDARARALRVLGTIAAEARGKGRD